MRERLIAKGAPANRVHVIPNWIDTTRLRPPNGTNAWAVENGLEDAFVVMHSGNVGHAQDLETLVRAATCLRDLDDLRIGSIGSGARHGEPDVADHRRIGHAENNVDTRQRESDPQRLAEVRYVIEPPLRQRRAVIHRRFDANDLNAVARLAARQIRKGPKPAGDDGDVEVLGKSLTQLGEQMRRRLDARPVILIQNEEAGLHRVAG
jgi:hypothetical protein